NRFTNYFTLPENVNGLIYETSYALQALCEYYLSEINYRRPEVLNAILNAATFLKNRDWNHVDLNSNIRGLGLWSLSESYKITNDCMTYKKIKEIGTYLVNIQ